MKREQIIELVKEHKDVLCSFIAEYHPLSKPKPLPITAPRAEAFRQQMIRESVAEVEDPAVTVALFLAAIAVEDIYHIASLLNKAWFSVPESTTCWQITGFTEAVNILEAMTELEEED